MSYGKDAGIEQWVHPHLFRHKMVSWLTAQGLPDAQIQLVFEATKLGEVLHSESSCGPT
jgi:site-specific recombinase XerD